MLCKTVRSVEVSTFDSGAEECPVHGYRLVRDSGQLQRKIGARPMRSSACSAVAGKLLVIDPRVG